MQTFKKAAKEKKRPGSSKKGTILKKERQAQIDANKIVVPVWVRRARTKGTTKE